MLLLIQLLKIFEAVVLKMNSDNLAHCGWVRIYTGSEKSCSSQNGWCALTLSWRTFPYTETSSLICRANGDLRHERVKSLLTFRRTCSVEINSKQQYFGTVFLTYSFMDNLTYSELYKKQGDSQKTCFWNAWNKY